MQAPLTGILTKPVGLKYKTHRAVDTLHEVITAVKITSDAIDEAYKMTHPYLQTYCITKLDTVVADRKYGITENLLTSHDREINPHMSAIQTKNKTTGPLKDIFPEEQFIYDKDADTLTCPAGKIQKRRGFHAHHNSIQYVAKGKDCRNCEFRIQCTRNSYSRSVQRHIRKEALDKMISITKSSKTRRDIKNRQYLMERS